MENTPRNSWQWHLEAAKKAAASSDFELAEELCLAAISLAEQDGESSNAAISALRALIDSYERLGDYIFTPPFPSLRGGLVPQPDRREIARQRHVIERRTFALVEKKLLAALDVRYCRMHTERADLLLRLANIHWQKFIEFDAFPLQQEALSIREHLFGADHPETIGVVETMARWHSALISFTKAIPLWERVLAHLDSATNQANATLNVLMRLGEAYEAVEAHTNAERVWRRVLDLTSQRAAELAWPPQILRFGRHLEALYGIGCACNQQGSWREAEELLQKAVAEHRQRPDQYFFKHGGTYSFGLDDGLHALATALRGLRRIGEAASALEEALKIKHQRGARLVRIIRDYAAVLRDLGRPEEASAQEEHAAAIEQEMAQRRRPRRACAFNRSS